MKLNGFCSPSIQAIWWFFQVMQRKKLEKNKKKSHHDHVTECVMRYGLASVASRHLMHSSAIRQLLCADVYYSNGDGNDRIQRTSELQTSDVRLMMKIV